MPVYKDGKKWRVVYRYKDHRGITQQTQKRGFKTQREAKEWEDKIKRKLNSDLNMTFGSFVELYTADRQSRVKENTWRTKEHIIRTKFLPFFQNRKLSEIQPRDIITWQNEMIQTSTKSGKLFSPDYLRTLNSQLSCIFNHAVQYYELSSNPVKKAGSMGKKGAKEMLFWTQDEYNRFSEVMMDKPELYYAFEVFYWTGCRCGELLALTPEDWDFEKLTLRINKSYQRIERRDVITDPKSEKSNRIIDIPDFLADEMQDYLKMLYGIRNSDRMFTMSKHSLHDAMETGSELAGVKRIRVHDLRHSHVSLLFELGFSVLAIAQRLGHESIDITYRYAHLFPSVQKEMAESLNKLRKKEEAKDVTEET